MTQLSDSQGQTHRCQWASDVSFDGIRVEVLQSNDEVLFDVSVPETGRLTLNTFGNQVDSELVQAAIELARLRQAGSAKAGSE